MWVLQDRNHCSTFAYQQTQGVPFETILQMHKSGYVPIPGLTIIFDVRPEEAVRRKGSSSLSGRKFDQNIGFNTSVRAKYASLADQLAGWDDSINYVDAMQSIDAVAEDTWAIVKNHYGL